MNKPAWLKEGMKVQFTADPKNPMGHGWDGMSFEATVGNTDGGDNDCHLIIDDDNYWVEWSEVSPLGSKKEDMEPKKTPNKTERKKIALKVKAAFDQLVKVIEEAEAVGLDINVYLNSDDYDEKYISASYQPPTPPKEEYIK